MNRKRNSTSPYLGIQKSSIQMKSLQQVARKKTSDSKFLMGLKRFLIQSQQKVQKRKRKSSGIERVSSDGNIKCESPENPPVLPIEGSSYGIVKRESRAEIPPVLSAIQQPASLINEKKKLSSDSIAVPPMQVMSGSPRYAHVRSAFDRNLVPLKIVQMCELRGKKYFIIKWKNCEIMDMVPTELAKERCPQIVIQFYEDHLINVHNRDQVDHDLMRSSVSDAESTEE